MTAVADRLLRVLATLILNLADLLHIGEYPEGDEDE